MKLFLREAVALENAEAARRMGLTNLAVWGEPKDITEKIRQLTESD